MLTFIDLFAGIGGFSLGFERVGMKCIGQVEIDGYCNKVLEKHWPDVKRVKDIYNVKGTEFGTVDIICGGVPCQPASTNGKRQGTRDDRWLWSEVFRLVKEIKPRWCMFENVRGILTLEEGLVFENLLSELEGYGYEVLTFIIPACAVDAKHRRDRIWIMANSKSERFGKEGKHKSERKEKWTSRSGEIVADTTVERLQREKPTWISRQQEQLFTECNRWSIEPGVGRMANGVSNRVDRLKALGNAVVPQIVEILGRCIIEAENEVSG